MTAENKSSEGVNSKETNAAGQTANRAKEAIKEVHHHHYYNKGFSFGKFFLGVLIIILGLFYLAKNTGWLPPEMQFDWAVFWPVLVILLGMSLLTGRGWFTFIVGVLVILMVIAAVALMIFSSLPGYRNFNPFGRLDSAANVDNTATDAQVTPISIPMESGAKLGVFELRGGAGKITLKGGSDKFVEGSLKSNFAEVEMASQLNGAIQKVQVEGVTRKPMMILSRWSNSLDLVLTHQIPLSVNLSTAAAEMEIDLTRVVAEIVNIETGASKLNLALGDKADLSQVGIKAGASALDLELPQTAGVEINLATALTSDTLDGFTKINDRTYRTSNYDSAAKKININLELGASSVKTKFRQ